MRNILCVIIALALVSACRPPRDSGRDAWVDEWKIVTTWGEGGQPSSDFKGNWQSGQMLPGRFDNRPNYDAEHPRTGILGLHPISAVEPAKIKFTGALRFDTPVLVVEAGGNVNGDCVLECHLNGEKVGEYVLDGTQWTTCAFDLSGKIQGAADLQLWVVGGGKETWHFEHGFIDDIYFAPKA